MDDEVMGRASVNRNPHSLCACLRYCGANPAPPPAHVVIVVEENHSYDDVVGNKSASYISFLADNGTVMTQSFAVTHPSEPNDVAVFTGGTFGLASDACPVEAGDHLAGIERKES